MATSSHCAPHWTGCSRAGRSVRPRPSCRWRLRPVARTRQRTGLVLAVTTSDAPSRRCASGGDPPGRGPPRRATRWTRRRRAAYPAECSDCTPDRCLGSAAQAPHGEVGSARTGLGSRHRAQPSQVERAVRSAVGTFGTASCHEQTVSSPAGGRTQPERQASPELPGGSLTHPSSSAPEASTPATAQADDCGRGRYGIPGPRSDPSRPRSSSPPGARPRRRRSWRGRSRRYPGPGQSSTPRPRRCRGRRR